MITGAAARSFAIGLEGVFSGLPLPPSGAGGTRFSVAPSPIRGDVFIGKDYDGKPVFLIKTIGSTRPEIAVPLCLENLLVHTHLKCRISSSQGEPQEGYFASVRFTGSDPQMQSYFIQFVGALLRELPSPASKRDVLDCVNQLVEIFREFQEPPKESMQSIWAELLLIAISSNPTDMVRLWHSEPGAVFDFSADHEKLEVKSTSFRRRHHQFSLEQLSPSSGTTVVIASVFVEKDEGGRSIQDLVQEIRDRVFSDAQALSHFEVTLGRLLGSAWKRISEERYDYQLALDSLAFYESSVVPSVPKKLPKEVFDVRFSVDLEEVASVDRGTLVSAGGLFSFL